ncbi:hypothetical protein C8R46DRAFT_1357232 [Mycena filopes]|nr:hypothetical protein C8R46DRAFT_1357232 [Mycena filopes]
MSLASQRPRRTRGGKDGVVLSDHRPGLIDAPRKKRTPAQVIKAKETEVAAAREKQSVVEESRSASIRRVAAKEDEMQREDEETRLHAARPDLVNSSSRETLPVDSPEHEDDMEDTFEAPPPSAMDSDSDGMALGSDDGGDDDFAGDGDDEDRDPDYDADDTDDADDAHASDADEDEDEDPEVQVSVDMGDDADADLKLEAAYAEYMLTRARKPAPKGKSTASSAPKVKPAPKATGAKTKGLLRAEIGASRDAIPVTNSSTSKRKAPAQMDPPPVTTKRAKPAEIGGLKSDCKKAASVVVDARSRSRTSTKSKSRASSKSSHMQTSEDDYYGGTVEDEAPESIAAASEAKATMTATFSRRAGTARMGITLTDVTADLTPPAPARTRKPRYTNDNLPFHPHERHDQLKQWQGVFLGHLIHWAGSLDDPFSAGASQPDYRSTVEHIWARVFPDIAINDAVYSVASSAIRTWRSEIGKRGVNYLDLFFAGNMNKVAPGVNPVGNIAQYVARELHEMAFVYREAPKKRGAYRSRSVGYTYAQHLRITSVVPPEERLNENGALALATAAVERAYTMWRTGTKIKQRVERRGKKSAHSFVAVPWADRAGKYLTVISRFGDATWEDVEVSADLSNAQWGVADESSDGPDPRLDIQLSSEEEPEEEQ